MFPSVGDNKSKRAGTDKDGIAALDVGMTFHCLCHLLPRAYSYEALLAVSMCSQCNGFLVSYLLQSMALRHEPRMSGGRSERRNSACCSYGVADSASFWGTGGDR